MKIGCYLLMLGIGWMGGAALWAEPISPRTATVGSLSEKAAIQKVLDKIKPAKSARLKVDRTEEREGRSYFVIQGYEVVIDDPKTGLGHTATWGWYYVDRQSGAVFEWDIVEDVLKRL